MIGLPLDHIAIHVADRKKAEATVRELLGHEHLQDLVVPSDHGHARLTVMVQRGERFRLVLCDADSEQHPIGHWIVARGPGVHHIAHRVERIEAALEHVESAGGTRVGDIVEDSTLRQIFTDVTSDGLLHELTQRATETDGFVERNVAALIASGANANATPPPLPSWSEDRR